MVLGAARFREPGHYEDDTQDLCCAQQTGMQRMMEATVLLSIYLRSELTLTDTRILSARCPLADVPGSACEAPPPRHLATETRPTHNNLYRFPI
jgi:hypothetical protein